MMARSICRKQTPAENASLKERNRIVARAKRHGPVAGAFPYRHRKDQQCRNGYGDGRAARKRQNGSRHDDCQWNVEQCPLARISCTQTPSPNEEGNACKMRNRKSTQSTQEFIPAQARVPTEARSRQGNSARNREQECEWQVQHHPLQCPAARLDWPARRDADKCVGRTEHRARAALPWSGHSRLAWAHSTCSPGTSNREWRTKERFSFRRN